MNSAVRSWTYSWVWIIASAIAFSGCAAFTRTIYPVTDGYHRNLPESNTTIVVWGNTPAVNGTATTWLQKRGLRMVERARLLQIFDEQHIRLTHTPDDEVPILRVGKLIGAGMVVFADGSSTAGIASNYSVTAYGAEVARRPSIVGS